MPGLNHKGPTGQGPMTGRRMGRCTNYGANLKKSDNSLPENKNENLTTDFPGRGFSSDSKRDKRDRGSAGRGLQNRYRRGI